MAKWDHADLLSVETKACLYPEYSNTEDLKLALNDPRNKPYHDDISKELDKRKEDSGKHA